MALSLQEICETFASFESFFQTRRQFDSNSVWLVAAICSYITGLPEILDRGNAFDICYNLLNHVSEAPEPQKKPDYLMDFSTDEQLNNFIDAKFLIDVFSNNPEKSEYFMKSPTTGIRSTYFYITDISKTSIACVRADDNGAYRNTRSTKKMYVKKDGKTYTTWEEEGRYYFNKKVTYNSFSKVFVNISDVIQLHRSYGKAKSFPLTRIIVTMTRPVNSLIGPYVGLFYNASNTITENRKVFSHGNSLKSNERPYFRTSKDILNQTKILLEQHSSPKTVYININRNSDGVFSSTCRAKS